MGKYIVHKPVNLDAVKAKRRGELSLTGYLETHYDAEAKYDGCCTVMKLYANGGSDVLSRTGERVYALEGVARSIETALRFRIAVEGGLVLIGEAWSPYLPQNEISGIFRRYLVSDRLRFVVFDALTMAEFEAGHSPVPKYIRRRRFIDIPHHGGEVPASSFFSAMWWNAGTYGNAQHLCNRMTDDPDGYDGLVLVDPLGTWTAGSGTTGEQVKLKRVLSFDLRVVGTEPGKGKHAGRIGALVVEFRGKRLGVGTGLSDAEREMDDWIGQIVEVEAMDYSADGLLREPRYKGIRHDKIEPDV